MALEPRDIETIVEEVVARAKELGEKDIDKVVREQDLETYKENLKAMLRAATDKTVADLYFDDSKGKIADAVINPLAEKLVTELRDTSKNRRDRQTAAVDSAVSKIRTTATHIDGTDEEHKIDGTHADSPKLDDMKDRYAKAKAEIEPGEGPQQYPSDVADAISTTIDRLANEWRTSKGGKELPDKGEAALIAYQDNLKKLLPEALICKSAKSEMEFALEPAQVKELAQKAFDQILTRGKEGMKLQTDLIIDTCTQLGATHPKANGKTAILDTAKMKLIAAQANPPEGHEIKNRNQIIDAVVDSIKTIDFGEELEKSKALVVKNKVSGQVENLLKAAMVSTPYQLTEHDIKDIQEQVKLEILANHPDVRKDAKPKISHKVDIGAIVLKTINERGLSDSQQKERATKKAVGEIVNFVRNERDAKDIFGSDLGKGGKAGADAAEKVSAAYTKLTPAKKGIGSAESTVKSAKDRLKEGGTVFKNPWITLGAVIGGLWLGIKKLFGSKTTTDEKGNEVPASRSWVDYVLGVGGLAVAGYAGYSHMKNRNGGGSSGGRTT